MGVVLGFQTSGVVLSGLRLPLLEVAGLRLAKGLQGGKARRPTIYSVCGCVATEV